MNDAEAPQSVPTCQTQENGPCFDPAYALVSSSRGLRYLCAICLTIDLFKMIHDGPLAMSLVEAGGGQS